MHRLIGVNLLLFVLLLALLLAQVMIKHPVPSQHQYSDQMRPVSRATAASNGKLIRRGNEANQSLKSLPQALPYEKAAAGTRSDPFSMSASVTGLIRYFAGQTNALGETLPFNDRRYLCGERLRVVMDFNCDPGLITICFHGRVWRFTGLVGVTHYETSIIVPGGSPTLSWRDERLSDALTLYITAEAREDPSQQDTVLIKDIDITGDIRQILRVQPVRWSLD